MKFQSWFFLIKSCMCMHTHKHTHTHTHTHTHIYIYIYIVIHRQTCFVLSELFSVARQARFLKLGSKPGWLKHQYKILPLSHEESSASEGNLNTYVSHLFVFYIYPLNVYRELDSYEEKIFRLKIFLYIIAKSSSLYYISWLKVKCFVSFLKIQIQNFSFDTSWSHIVCVCVCVCVCVWIYIHIYIYIYIYI